MIIIDNRQNIEGFGQKDKFPYKYICLCPKCKGRGMSKRVVMNGGKQK